jgi:glycosyltransferase involved in cell wall biosynthesis
LLSRHGVKVLLCHNFYRQRGGEDESVEDEAKILERHGHEVLRYTRESAEAGSLGLWNLARVSVWNRRTYDDVRALIARERPDVIHCTNIVPLISPSVYDAADAEGVAIVQALRNYRYICPGALLLRDGRVCEACVHKTVPWPAIMHGCYQDSRLFTAGLTATFMLNRARHGWTGKIDMYFAPSDFTRRKYMEAGLPAERIAIKPNWIDPDPGPGTGSAGYAVFVGRLSPEKGVDTLLDAWRLLTDDLRLVIVGDGPLAGHVAEAAAADSRIEWIGLQPKAEVLRRVGDAVCLVMPSLTYETFGRTIVEAFSRGTPAVVSGTGAMAELVDSGVTGYHARPGDPRDLADAVARMFARTPDERARMREAARQQYLQKFTGGLTHGRLMDIYGRAREFRRARAA